MTWVISNHHDHKEAIGRRLIQHWGPCTSYMSQYSVHRIESIEFPFMLAVDSQVWHLLLQLGNCWFQPLQDSGMQEAAAVVLICTMQLAHDPWPIRRRYWVQRSGELGACPCRLINNNATG